MTPPTSAARMIRPGEPWLDTEGKRIHAHGGSVILVGGTFYWYGENKERTTGADDIWHWGVRAYSSSDLVNWQDRGLIIPPDLEDPTSPMHPRRQMDRPHIIRNERNGTFVCWVKVMGAGEEQSLACYQSDTVLGPYKEVARDVHPCGMSAGDFDLVVDPRDGKAYIYFERPHSELICADLDIEYTAFTGYYSTHFADLAVPEVREAPAYFRRGRRHYLLTSGTSGYFPNPTMLAVADTYHGPWTVIGSPHIGKEAEVSFRSQISCVLPNPFVPDGFITVADRWLPRRTAAESDQRALFRAFFDDESKEADLAPMLAAAGTDLDRADTSLADYVWLPLTFEDERGAIRWHQEWSPEKPLGLHGL